MVPPFNLLDRQALGSDTEREPVVYGRVCSSCGHYELSEDPLIVSSWRQCPSCTVRGARDHGRT
jgi:hypothetical protein